MKGGTAAALINAASYPFLISVYSPSSFGIYSLFLYASMVLGAVSFLRFDMIIPTLAESDVFRYVKLCFSLILLFAISVLSIWVIVSQLWGLWANGLYTSIAIILYGTHLLLLSVLVQKNNMSTYNKVLVGQVLTCVLLQLLFGLLMPGWAGLLIGYLTSFFPSFFIFVYYLVTRPLNDEHIETPYRQILSNHRRTWMPNSVQTFANTGSLYLLAQGVAHFGGLSEVGLFSICQRILTIPVRIVGNSVKQVLLKYLSVSDGRTRYFYLRKYTFILTIISLFIFGALSFLASWISVDSLYPDWVGFEKYVAPVSIWLAITMIYVPSVSILNIYGNTSPHMLYEIASVAGKGLIIFGAVYYGVYISPVNFVYLTSILSVVLSLFIILSAFKVAKNENS